MRAKHLRKRPWWKRPAPQVVIAALLLGAAGGVWAATRSGSSATAAATRATSTSVPLPTSTTGAPTSAVPSTSVAVSPTTVAIGPPVSAPGSLTYTMATGIAIKLVASNPCWIEVRAAAHGPITRVTTLQAGQALTLASPFWLRMGNPSNVHVTAGSTALRLPNGPGDLIIKAA
jgi:RodZ C-terminal domain